MSRLSQIGLIILIILTTTVTACTAPASVRPIGTIVGSAKYRVSCHERRACDSAIAKICVDGHDDVAYKPGNPMSFDAVCLVGSQALNNTVERQSIQVSIRPECMNVFYGPEFLLGARDKPRPDSVPWDPSRAKAFAYKDLRAGLILYVESDGRHFAAIDSNGRLLWVRNPFEDAGLCPYRSPHPVIYEIEVADSLPDFGGRAGPYLQKLGMISGHAYVRIYFDSSQFGLVDETSGNFFFEGQN